MMYQYTPEQHQQVVDALNRVDAVNRGMVTTNAHKYARRNLEHHQATQRTRSVELRREAHSA